MPYKSVSNLPAGVQNNLPKHAQEIYKSAFNSAYEDNEDEEDAEQTAHRIAWSAVKQKYEKSANGSWHKKG